MDPISVTASILTILGATAKASQALELVADLHHAPDQLLALMNEVSVFDRLTERYKWKPHSQDRLQTYE